MNPVIMGTPLAAAVSSPIAILLLILFCLLLARITRNYSRSSLVHAATPAHWSCVYSSLWIWLHRIRQQDTAAVHKAHLRHGIFVRLAPDEISICGLNSGLKPIYEGRLPKTDWYQIWSSHGEEPMFAMKDEERHSQRKRMLAKPYLKSTIMSNQTWLARQRDLSNDLRAAVRELADRSLDVDLYDLFFAWNVASISTFVYGPEGGANLLRDLSGARKLRRKDTKERSKQAWGTTFSFLPQMCLRCFGISTQISWIQDMQQRAQNICDPEQVQEDSNVPSATVFSYVKSTMLHRSDTKLDGEETVRSREQRGGVIASELQDHLVAGIDSSTTALTTCAWLLSCPENCKWQDRLRREVDVFDDNIDALQLDNLPVLDAIVKETLRLHPPVAGCQPRINREPLVVSHKSAHVTIPPNTIVHAQAWTLHRNPEVFQDPGEWRPERWLECSPERKKQMNAWLWAFGSGSRRCLGENLAISSLKVALVTIWATFETAVTVDTRFVLGQGNLALPVPDRNDVFLKLHVGKVRS